MVEPTAAEFDVGRRACSWTQIAAKVQALYALKRVLTALEPALSDDWKAGEPLMPWRCVARKLRCAKGIGPSARFAPNQKPP